MKKTFLAILVGGMITAKFGEKTTLINTGSCPLFLTDDETKAALQTLDYAQQQAVLNSEFALKPGESQKLTTGSYNLEFAMSFGGSAVLFTEVAPPAPAKKTPPAPTQPAAPAPPAPVPAPVEPTPVEPTEPAPVEPNQPA